MTSPTIPELLQALANGLRRDLELLTDLDARLSADPCQCGPCTEARTARVDVNRANRWELLPDTSEPLPRGRMFDDAGNRL